MDLQVLRQPGRPLVQAHLVDVPCISCLSGLLVQTHCVDILCPACLSGPLVQTHHVDIPCLRMLPMKQALVSLRAGVMI